MPGLDECCVLIPASTLEDFPTSLDEDEARSLLAAWTVLWHPELIAKSQQWPVWYRADAPPEPVTGTPALPEPESSSDGISLENSSPANSSQATDPHKPFAGRLIAAPLPSLAQLPAGYSDRVRACGAIWVEGKSRQEMAQALGLPDLADQVHESRSIGVEDFYAAGFAALQIQVMTRRLRYTSNLDQIYLETRLVVAAKAFLEQNTAEAIAALHDVFDALSEERDHYFTSDPHLIDLTLVTRTTVDSAIANLPTVAAEEIAGILPTPTNVLLDADAIESLAGRDDEPATRLRTAMAEGHLGWAAGGPPSDVHFDALDYQAASDVLIASQQKTSACIGATPQVYARFAGGTPSDLIDVIAGLGYRGLIPIDFAAGTGYGEEAKVLFPTSGEDLEALTAKPIDAASDAAFLNLGARLGEAIDSGEIATGLLVHWPGQQCDSFRDLKRLASWSVSLGRFWNLTDYFINGEKPYHHGSLSATSDSGGSLLQSLVESETENPISGPATAFCQSLHARQQDRITGMADLAGGLASVSAPASETSSFRDSVQRLTQAVGATLLEPSGSPAIPAAKLLVNDSSVATRMTTSLSQVPAALPHLFAVSRGSQGFDVTVDIPAGGFAWIGPSEKGSGDAAPRADSPGIGHWLRDKFLGKPTTIAEAHRLHNEFMEVTISDESGGIAGVYSGTVRGNRFSMRLVAVGCGNDVQMKCQQSRVVQSSAAIGQIETRGQILTGGKDGERLVAEFSLLYSLKRGSRVLEVTGTIIPKVTLGEQPWQSYLAARTAVSQEAAICRPILRDKLHRLSGKRIVAPLGLLIDEPERKTLVSSDGLAFHRSIDGRFFDTLLCARGETNSQFNLRYGFDVPSPVATAQQHIAKPIEQPVQPKRPGSTSGWLVSVLPADVLMSDLRVHRLADDRLAVEIRLIQSQSKSCRAKLRLCRDVQQAFQVDGDLGPLLEQLGQAKRDEEGSKDETGSKEAETKIRSRTELVCKDDVIEIPMASFGTGHVLAIIS